MYERTLTPNLGLELVVGIPPRIKSRATGSVAFLGDNVLSAKNVAPTLLMNYYFGDASSTIRPYVGLGLNYTHLSPRSVSAIGSNIGSVVDLHVGSSWGLAAQAGVSYRINDRWSAQASVATFRVKSRLTVRAGGLERSVTMRMNPVAAAAALSYSF